MASPSNGIVAPRANWRGLLSEAATEVFSMMAGAQLAPAAGVESTRTNNVTGTVSIAGAVRAVFSFRCSTEAAARIASGMLGISVEEAAGQKWDAVGEICNIMAGHFKAKIGLEAECMLTVPTVIAGSNYRIHTLPEGECIEIPMVYEGETVLVALEVRK